MIRNAEQIPIYSDQLRGSVVLRRGIINSDITQGYVNEPGFPLYAFGYGLLYNNFVIVRMKISSTEHKPDGKIEVHV